MPGDTLSRDAFQEEQNTTYHFAPWMFGEGRLKKGSVEDIQERPAEKKHSWELSELSVPILLCIQKALGLRYILASSFLA